MLFQILLFVISLIIAIIVKCFQCIFLEDHNAVTSNDVQLDDYEYIIDVRTQQEWDQGHHPRAKHIPITELEKGIYFKLKNIPKDTSILVYCKRGVRAKKVNNILKDLGYTNTKYLKGSHFDIKN